MVRRRHKGAASPETGAGMLADEFVGDFIPASIAVEASRPLISPQTL